MKFTLKRCTIYSVILLFAGIVVLSVGLLMGGSLLDGFAGGPMTNTSLEDSLLRVGVSGGLAGLGLLGACLAMLVIKKLLLLARRLV
jgi:hypothetical protein